MIAAALLAASEFGLSASPLSTIDCSRLAAQVDGDVAAASLDVAALIRDGDREVAAAARRFETMRSTRDATHPDLVNATQDLRYRLQVCARR